MLFLLIKILLPIKKKKKKAKMQTDPLTFTFFSFQFANFQFCQFSLLSFNFCQFGTPLNFSYLLPLDPLKRCRFASFYFFFYFYNLELKENKKNLKKENIKGPLNQNKTKKPKSLTRLTLRERERLSYNRRPVPELLQHDGGHGG